MTSCVDDLAPDIRKRYRLRELRRMRYRFLDRPFVTYSNDPEILQVVDSIYARFRDANKTASGIVRMFLIKEADGGKACYQVADPGFNSFVCDDLDEAVSFWAAQLMIDHLVRLDFLLVHCSALLRDGTARLFLGGSRSGKTTLTVKLAQAQYGFLSDETGPLNLETGLVHPFPRAFLLREKGFDKLPGGPWRSEQYPSFLDHQEAERGMKPPRRFIVPPESLCSSFPTEPAQVGALFFLNGFSDGSTVVRPLAPAEALKIILDNSINPGYLPPDRRQRAVEMLVGLLQAAPCFSVRLGALGEQPAELSRCLARAERSARVGKDKDLEAVARKCEALLREKA